MHRSRPRNRSVDASDSFPDPPSCRSTGFNDQPPSATLGSHPVNDPHPSHDCATLQDHRPDTHPTDTTSTDTTANPAASSSMQPPTAPSNSIMPPNSSEVTDSALVLLLDHCGARDPDHPYHFCPTEPPITPDSLAELDTTRIVNNPKLRHDINSDRELHFRPNLDGPRGQQKIRAADQYWSAVQVELRIIQLVQQKRADPAQAQADAHWMHVLRASKRRLANIFAAIRDILKSLVPDADQTAITDRLDVDFIMRQIDNGVCDLVDLARWLAKVIKTHCAPMRDGLVDAMRGDVTRAARAADPVLMTDGLRQLMTILEAMKLDVANHHIRHIRPLLINDTVNFHRRYNSRRMELGKIMTDESRAWLERETSCLRAASGTAPAALDALCSALLRDLVEKARDAPFTPTLYLDGDRLKLLRAEIHSYIYTQICKRLLRDLSPTSARAEVEKAAEALQTYLVAIVGPQARFVENIDNIAVQIVYIVLILQGSQTVCDAALTSAAVDRLTRDLVPHSLAFSMQAEELQARLLPKLRSTVASHVKMSALELQDALVPMLPFPSSHPAGFGAVLELAPPPASPDLDSPLIRRLAHIIVLHWQIWADLVYLAPPKQRHRGAAETEPLMTPATSPPSSPLPLAAQPNIEPACKFLTVPSGAHSGLQMTGMPTPSPTPPPDGERSDANNDQGESATGNHSSLSPD